MKYLKARRRRQKSRIHEPKNAGADSDIDRIGTAEDLNVQWCPCIVHKDFDLTAVSKPLDHMLRRNQILATVNVNGKGSRRPLVIGASVYTHIQDTFKNVGRDLRKRFREGASRTVSSKRAVAECFTASMVHIAGGPVQPQPYRLRTTTSDHQSFSGKQRRGPPGSFGLQI